MSFVFVSSQAEAIALSVAQAFNIAFEYWEDQKDVIETGSASVGSSPPQGSASAGSSPPQGSMPIGLSLPAQENGSKLNGIVINRTELEDLPEVCKLAVFKTFSISDNILLHVVLPRVVARAILVPGGHLAKPSEQSDFSEREGLRTRA